MKNITDAFTVRFHMQVRRVRDVYIKSICLYVFVSCKESTKRRQSAWTGVTSRQNHRLGIVWTKPSKSTANRSHLSSCIPRTLPLPPPPQTYGPSLFRYLSRDVCLRRVIHPCFWKRLPDKIWRKSRDWRIRDPEEPREIRKCFTF